MAHRTRQQLIDDANTALPSNQAGGISAGHVRGRLLDAAESMLHKDDRASDAEAAAGTDPDKIMSAEKTKKAITTQVPVLPVTPTGAVTERPLKDWLATSPINTYTGNRTLAAVDKGAYVYIDSASDRTVTLPADWAPGEGCAIRRLGAGNVLWAFDWGASGALPQSRITHTRIAERHAEIFVRVISNPGGIAAVWAIEGATVL